MVVYTLFCETCKQFLPAVVIQDPPYSVCSTHEEDRFNELLGYDRGEMEAHLKHSFSYEPLPKIKKAPK